MRYIYQNYDSLKDRVFLSNSIPTTILVVIVLYLINKKLVLQTFFFFEIALFVIRWHRRIYSEPKGIILIMVIVTTKKKKKYTSIRVVMTSRQFDVDRTIFKRGLMCSNYLRWIPWNIYVIFLFLYQRNDTRIRIELTPVDRKSPRI